MRASLALETGFAAPNTIDLHSARIVRLGRNRLNDIVLHDQHASRDHAELYFDNDGWMVRDLNTTNGTRVNGTRISEPAFLRHSEVIGIGEVRLRFTCLELPVDPDAKTPQKPDLPPSVPSSDVTTFQADDLTALVDYINMAGAETTVNGLVRRSLETIYGQLQATVCGYLSLDRKEPLWRSVLPTDAVIDPALLEAITEPVKSQKQALWVRALQGEDVQRRINLDRFAGKFKDALCIPLLSNDKPALVLGLLVVLQDRNLADRQVHFCQVLSDCLANNLRLLKVRRALEGDLLRYRGVRMGGRAEEIVGSSDRLQTLRDHIRRMADSSTPLLIQGPTGSGKELVALAVHRSGRRRAGPFIEVNCASVPLELAESQFFGHISGAFSGATSDYTGHFQQADEGILFLDEVADLHLDVQAKLLRAFQSGSHRISFKPLGAQDYIQVSVRVLAATHRDLRQLVAEKRFREDLYFRLAMTEIQVPSLEAHSEDIPDLVRHFLDRLNPEYHRHADPVTISTEATARLMAAPWPGNVRQLRAVLEQAIALSEPGSQIEAVDLNLPSLCQRPTTLSPRLPTLNVAELEEMAIQDAIRQTTTQMQAAALLGMHRDTLRTKWEKIQQKHHED